MDVLNTKVGIEPLSLTWDDITTHELLGSGAFGSVFRVDLRSEVRAELEGADVSDDDSEEESDVDDMVTAATFFEDSSSEEIMPEDSYPSRQLVIKCIKNDEKVDTSKRRVAAQCMAAEAAILASLPRHPNVIHLVGMSADISQKTPLQGFLVLERVEDTLDNVLQLWRVQRDESMPKTRPLLWRRAIEEKKQIQRSRMQQVGLGLASALQFLHTHGVLHRDVKPANVGISRDGQVKLLDFGSACTYNAEEERKLTMAIGTIRYMSPEVANSHVYGPPADVHSFSILLWEVLTLRRPFAGMAKTKKELKRIIHICRTRPSLSHVPSATLRRVLRSGWDPEPHRRPDFARILNELQIEAEKSKKAHDKNLS